MQQYEFDTAIIGGGCIGASIFFSLNRSGIPNVVLIDQGRKTGATANSGGMLRVFHEDPHHIELALGMEKQLRAIQEIPINREKNGSLYFFHKNRYKEFLGFEKMHAANYPFEILNATQGEKRFPLQWKQDEWAVYEPLGGHIDPISFSDQLINFGKRNGYAVCEDFDVQRISVYRNGYRISGPNSTIMTRSLILAGGARLIPRLQDLGLSFPLHTKELNAHIFLKKLENQLPNFFDRETLEFGRLGKNSPLILSHPGVTRVNVEGETRELKALDCYSPGRRGICGRIPGHPRLFIAMGWGGTAFKFSLKIGQQIAREVEQNFGGKIYA